MTDGKRGFFRDNLVLVAAFALPAVVAALFLLATAIPQWTVPLPQHDLVLRVEDYSQTRQPEVIVEFVVRDGRLEADVRPVPQPANPAMGVPYVPAVDSCCCSITQRCACARFRSISRETLPQGEMRTIVVDALAGTACHV